MNKPDFIIDYMGNVTLSAGAVKTLYLQGDDATAFHNDLERIRESIPSAGQDSATAKLILSYF